MRNVYGEDSVSIIVYELLLLVVVGLISKINKTIEILII